MAKKIPLTKGKFAIVDNTDYEWLNQWKWFAQKTYKGNFYAARAVRVGLKQKHIYMHRAILGLDSKDQREGDHINGDGLCNLRSNLRIATHVENGRNRGKSRNNTSGYKGVGWFERDKKWRVYIRVNGKQIYLGAFYNIKDAAMAYDEAARKYYGEFALTNQIGDNQ